MIDSIGTNPNPLFRNLQAQVKERRVGSVQRMEKQPVRQIVKEVINDAIAFGSTTHKKIVKAGIPNGPLGKIRHAENNFGVDYLDKLAAHFQVEAWQLICPTRLSNEARDLGRVLDAIESRAERAGAYALALQVLMQNPHVKAAFEKVVVQQANAERSLFL